MPIKYFSFPKSLISNELCIDSLIDLNSSICTNRMGKEEVLGFTNKELSTPDIL